ncbi:hypothetical protein D9M71_245760 [compost metagenome]
MIELAVQLLLIADLCSGQPLATQFVDTVDPIAGANVEGAVAAHVIRQVQAQAQVVGATTATARVDHQGVVAALVHHPVLNPVEVVQAVQGTHVGLQAPQLQGFADRLANVEADHVVADLRVVLDPDGSNDRRALARRARDIQFGIAAVGAFECSQARVQGTGGAVAGIDHFLGTAKIGDAETGQRRLDQDVVAVQLGQLLLGVASGHQGDRLVEYIDHGCQLLAITQR